MARACTVCVHPHRVAIEAALVDRSISQKDLGKRHGLNTQALQRHFLKHVRGNSATALAIHREITQGMRAHEHASAIGSQVTALANEAQKDRQHALERGDYKLALRAIDTLLKAFELQARLVLDVERHRASDVANHPVWHDLSGLIMTELDAYPDARDAVMRVIAKRLQIDVPIVVQATPGGTPLPPSPG